MRVSISRVPARPVADHPELTPDAARGDHRRGPARSPEPRPILQLFAEMLDRENEYAARRGWSRGCARPTTRMPSPARSSSSPPARSGSAMPERRLDLHPVIDRLLVRTAGRGARVGVSGPRDAAGGARVARSSRCPPCPRLVAWREQVARDQAAPRSPTRTYWGRPVPGFGDPARRGADAGAGPGRPRRQPHRPGVHRRPRRATGCSASLHRAGLANQPTLGPARRRADAARLPGSPPRCGARRRPTSRRPAERDTCLPWLRFASSTCCRACA